jgi:hypothetical protein
MSADVRMEDKVDALELGFAGYEEAAEAIFEEAQRAAALIPGQEFEEVFEAAPPLEFHHKYVQSLLTWIWYEVHENEVPLENLPLSLALFFETYEKLFATYWQ